jgi:hypothetical protein
MRHHPASLLQPSIHYLYSTVLPKLLLLANGCRWGKPVVVYGPAGLGRDHTVVQFLVAEARCSAVHYYKPG